MILHLKLNMDNAAFSEDNKRKEAYRILTKLARNIYDGHDPEKLKDINGNTCGEVWYTK